jgi:hypothetical protein
MIAGLYRCPGLCRQRLIQNRRSDLEAPAADLGALPLI